MRIEKRINIISDATIISELNAKKITRRLWIKPFRTVSVNAEVSIAPGTAPPMKPRMKMLTN